MRRPAPTARPLADAVREVGARIVQLPPFTQDGRLPDGQPMNAPPQILQTAYALTKGGESDVIDAGQGQYFVLRLDDIQPAALPTLAEIREPLAQHGSLRENARRLTAKAEELAARVRGGEDIAAVAASAGATLATRTGRAAERGSPGRARPGVLGGLFGQGRGQVFTRPGLGNGLRRRSRRRGPRRPLPPSPPRSAIRSARAWPRNWSTAPVKRSSQPPHAPCKAENDPARAIQALGVTPPAARRRRRPAAPATMTPRRRGA